MMRKLIFILLAMTSCMSTEVIGIIPEQVDTMSKKPQKPLPPPLPPRDTTEVDDTSKVGIGFNPTVEDWEGTDVDM